MFLPSNRHRQEFINLSGKMRWVVLPSGRDIRDHKVWLEPFPNRQGITAVVAPHKRGLDRSLAA